MFDGDKLIPVSHLDGKLALRQCYDKAHGLNTGPFGILMTDEESPAKFSLYEHWAGVFVKERINKHFGYTFDDFLKRPRYKLEILINSVRPLNKEEDSQAEDVAKKIAESMKTEKS